MPPSLVTSRVPASPRGVVLMLHGGAAHGERPVDGRSLSYRRTRAMYSSIGHKLVDSGHAVWLLRFSVKGWNATAGREPSPVADARWALDRVREEYAALPVVLLGHSMGARTAVHVADDPSVTGVVGLAPWLQGNDPVRALAGRHIVAAHGSRDRITSARATEAFLRRADRLAASTRFIDMGSVGHYMLSHVREWNEVALSETLGVFDRSGADAGAAENTPG